MMFASTCIFIIFNCILTIQCTELHNSLYNEPPVKLSDLIKQEPQDPYSVVYGLMNRVLQSPDLVSQFTLEIIPTNKTINNKFDNFNLDTFELDNNGTSIILRGSNIISLCCAFNYYLINSCNTSYDWKTYSIDLPLTNKLPLPDYKQYTRSVPISYHENICTFSYTQAFWNWTVWEKHIDWMVMQGINMPLSLTGNEYIWTKTYMRPEFNLTMQDLQQYFSGPAFFAWQRMGNIRGWGGPLTENFIMYHYNLQIQILSRMNSFQMYPVLGGFSGHIPYAIKSKFPSANVTYAPNWHNFPPQYCCVMLLDFMDPLFNKIGTAFYEEQLKYYIINNTNTMTTPHIYSTDQFNEIDPPTNNTEFLRNATYQTYSIMNNVDPNSIWLLQGTFLLPHAQQEGNFWNNITAQAYLSGVNNDEMIILDLDSATRPQYYHFDDFYGKKWIWNTLYNFGAEQGIAGNLINISVGIPNAKLYPNSSIYGVGTTMEGLENNYILYDLTYRMGWNPSINLNEYIYQYVYSRYGLPQSINITNSSMNNNDIIQNMIDIWTQLNVTLYDINGIRAPKSKLIENPAFFKKENYLSYNISNIQKIWKLFVKIGNVLQNQIKFQNDLIDITRQCLSDLFIMNLINFTLSYNKNVNIKQMNIYKNNMLNIINDTDLITATNEYWLLGNWIYDALNIANLTNDNKDWLEFNARNLITLWGNNGEISNYASKQWNGIIQYYYKPQWQLFFDLLYDKINNNQTWDQTEFNKQNMNKIEIPFQTNTSHPFIFKPIGNTVDISCKLYIKYNLFGDAQCN